MQKLILIPQLDACDFDGDVEMELADNEVNTHYQDDTVYLDWEDEEDFPITKAWLLETYGEEAKKYDTFAISAT